MLRVEAAVRPNHIRPSYNSTVRLIQALQSPFLIGDGANGTRLADFGFNEQPYDTANLLAPQLVLRVHKEYIDAGADFIEINTFQKNRLLFRPIPA